MSNSILDNINNAAGGRPYNGAGISAGGTGQGGLSGVSNINANQVNLGSPMTLTHSLQGIKPIDLCESRK